MRCRSILAVTAVMIALVLELEGCHIGPMPYVPDLNGTYVANSASIQGDKKTVANILKTFKQAETAVEKRDLDALMALYADGYKHRGFTKDSLRTEWKHLFENYRDFSSTHVFTDITVEPDKSPRTARVTCTGSLWAVANESNERVNIDSWFAEVHYLIESDGGWRIRGHAWEMADPKETRFARAPHPFF